MADSVKLLRRNVTSLTVSDRVSVGRTFFDGQKSGEKYSDYLPVDV